VVIEPCTGLADQSWDYHGGSLVVFGNKCLDVTDGRTNNGNKVQIWECGGGNANQQFSITSGDRIVWTDTHECLDLTNGQLIAGTQIQMWQCTANDSNQVWYITPW